MQQIGFLLVQSGLRIIKYIVKVNIQRIQLLLIDIQGNTIKSIENNTAQNSRLNVSTIPNGMYFLKIIADDEFITKQVIVNH